MSNGKEHIRADCNACGKWLKWLKKTPRIMSIMLATSDIDREEILPKEDTVNHISDMIRRTKENVKKIGESLGLPEKDTNSFFQDDDDEEGDSPF
jgi:hypothetical protein